MSKFTGVKTFVGCFAVMGLVASCGDNGSNDDGEFSATGNVTMTVGHGPGGGSDRGARVMAEAFGETGEGYNVVVENREGGGGAVGWTHVFNQAGNANYIAKADAALNTVPLTEGTDVPWSYEDFTPIALFAEDTRMIVSPADAPFDTCDELIEATNEDRVTGGIVGTGGPDGLSLHVLEENGLDLHTVPYDDTGELVTALLGGQIAYGPAPAAGVRQYIESGDFKGLCVLNDEPFEDDVLGDVETSVEQGLEGTVAQWRGLIGPPDLTEEQQDFWIGEVEAAVETDTYAEYIETDLLISTVLYGDEFMEYLHEFDEQAQAMFE